MDSTMTSPSDPKPYRLVPCPHCDHGIIVSNSGGREYERICPYCKGTGTTLSEGGEL